MDDAEIEKFISEDSQDAFEQENLILSPLLDEIGCIADMSIQLFVRSVLLNSPFFWVAPVMPDSSSISCDWPKDVYCVGGDVLNTKRVFRASVLLSDSYQLEMEDRDMLFAAALVHSVTKYEVKAGEMEYNDFYPFTFNTFIEELRSRQQELASDGTSNTLAVPDDTVRKICRLVRCQNGPWSIIPEMIPTNVLEICLHLSVYIAMAVDYVIDGTEVVEERWGF